MSFKIPALLLSVSLALVYLSSLSVTKPGAAPLLFTNVDSLKEQNNLKARAAGLSSAIMNLGSGKRVNTAKEDAAGAPIYDSLTVQVNGLTLASRDATDGL